MISSRTDDVKEKETSMVLQAPTWGTETLADLMRVDGKAELIAGRIVHFMPGGRRHNIVAANIYSSLRIHWKTTKVGEAYTDNVGFKMVPPMPSGRQSFSPDASYYMGHLAPADTGFIDGPPTFAAEVRSEDDYGPAAEDQMAEKRAEYFQAGTLVVWDVDWKRSETVTVYRANDPANPTTYRRGDIAEALPALPGWTIPVAEVFE